ncbi:unnamed protein product, partial [Amoebophrya sp. A25]
NTNPSARGVERRPRLFGGDFALSDGRREMALRAKLQYLKDLAAGGGTNGIGQNAGPEGQSLHNNAYPPLTPQ